MLLTRLSGLLYMQVFAMHSVPRRELVTLAVPSGRVEGLLALPADARGMVLFAHGSGSSRHSPRNNAVASVLRNAGFGTLLMDLLTPGEDHDTTARFDIDLLVERLALAADSLAAHPATAGLPLGLFGASTGAASALRLAALRPGAVGAVVSRGGRPDLAGKQALSQVRAPTLLIVGTLDTEVLALNRQAAASLRCVHHLETVAGATHLFEERGALDIVAGLAARWFVRHLTAPQEGAAL